MRSPFVRLLPLAILLFAPLARADLIPPGGEGVSECRNKKAGDACKRAFFEESGIRFGDGTCVEAKLDHLPLKYKAHLRCEVTEPAASASASAPVSAPVSATASASASASAPVSASASASAPASVSAPVSPSATNSPTPPESPRGGGGCSMTGSGTGDLFVFVVALGLWARRRRVIG